jgi:hypothetical protein
MQVQVPRPGFRIAPAADAREARNVRREAGNGKGARIDVIDAETVLDIK